MVYPISYHMREAAKAAEKAALEAAFAEAYVESSGHGDFFVGTIGAKWVAIGC